jgi:hypothetical protein
VNKDHLSAEKLQINLVNSEFLKDYEEAKSLIKYNKLWYRAQKALEKLEYSQFSSKNFASSVFTLTPTSNDELSDFEQKKLFIERLKAYAIDKLRFQNPVSFMFFESMILPKNNIEGLIEHYQQSAGCRPRLDFINTYIDLFNFSHEITLDELAADVNFSVVVNNDEIMARWRQHELEDRPKWSGYIHKSTVSDSTASIVL